AAAARFCPGFPPRGRDWLSRRVLARDPGIGTQQSYYSSCPDLFPRVFMSRPLPPGNSRPQVRGGPVRTPTPSPPRRFPKRELFLRRGVGGLLYSSSASSGEGPSVSMSQAVARHVPYLRRYARALTGSQNAGDAYVAATLEALIEDPAVLSGSMSLRVALYRTFSRIWTSVPVNDETEPMDPRDRV